MNNNNQDGKRPQFITINLYNGLSTSPIKTTTADAESNWTYSFAGLDEFNKGNRIVYTVVETAVDGYTTIYLPNENGIDIKNIYKEAINKMFNEK